MIPRVLVPAACLALACAGAGSQMPIPLTPVPEGSPPRDFVATGEVQGAQRGAAFDDWRVVGPHVNMIRRTDGTWAGSILGWDVILNPSTGMLSGSGATLHFVRWGPQVMVRGTLGRQDIQVRITPGPGSRATGGIVCRAALTSVDCSEGEVSESGRIVLRGQAALPDAPQPQFGLAVLASLL